MSRLNDNQVERLLKEAAPWEPDAQMPESLIRSALTQSPRRRRAPLMSALSLSGAAFAGIMAFVVFRPEVPPTITGEPTSAPVMVVPGGQPVATPGIQPASLVTKPETSKSTSAAPAQVAQNTEKPSTVSKPSNRREGSRRRHSSGRRRSSDATIRSPRKEARPDTTNYAKFEDTNEPKPLPENAIALDESPKIVPVVVADTDPETGEVLLRPAVATVPTTAADAPISLE